MPADTDAEKLLVRTEVWDLRCLVFFVSKVETTIFEPCNIVVSSIMLKTTSLNTMNQKAKPQPVGTCSIEF